MTCPRCGNPLGRAPIQGMHQACHAEAMRAMRGARQYRVDGLPASPRAFRYRGLVPARPRGSSGHE